MPSLIERFSHRTLILSGVGLVVVGALIVLMVGRDDAMPAGASAASARPGAMDSVVTLDTTAQRLAGIELGSAQLGSGNSLTANGTITFDANHVSVVAPRAEGRIVEVLADLGQRVAAGAVLAIVESPEVGETRGDLERARAAVSVSKRNYEREKRLYEQEISPQKEMLDAEVLYRTAEADLRSAESKLRTYGAFSGRGGSYGLRSAVSGTVVDRNASPGQIVGPNASIFTVADLSHVWITVDVFESDLGRVHEGAAAVITPTAAPGTKYPGRVSFAGGVVDSTSRTVKVRVLVENTTRQLRPGMFARVTIAAPSGTPAVGVTVPAEAVQEIDGKSVVFVAVGTGRFVARSVVLNAPLSGMESVASGSAPTVTVLKGLQPGERLAVKGAFQLKAELTKASFAGED